MQEDKTSKSDRAKREEEILAFWKENKIFEKTLEKKAPKGDFVFYEGPPTANGRPGIHHLESRAFKDAIPRYKTMRGYHVPRKAGWDTHGLPVELEVEKALKLKSKKEIEEFGVAKFNEKCKENVWKYVDEWTEFTERIGYWIDLDNPYVTYKNSYIESVWNIISEVDKKGLLYKDYKVVPWCPRCGTGLSSHELAQGYQDVKSLSVTSKFKLTNLQTSNLPTYLLAWTTTPWTLPGNVALAVNENIDYREVELDGERLIVAETLVSKLFSEHIASGQLKLWKLFKGKELVGLEYEPLYPFLKENYQGDSLDKAYKVYSADFVNTEEGTGIVHTAVMYGQDDFILGNEIGLPKHHLVDEAGLFTPETGFLAGRFVKDEETSVEIIKDLAHRGLLFKKEKYEHSYPHCWRCKTPLIYYARDSWYIRMSDLRNKLVKENQKINWEPEHIKEGRFGEWLREVKDWALSRERYWGTPLPVWVQAGNDQETRNKKQKYIVVNSLETLKKYAKPSQNKYFLMRHGHAENNLLKVVSSGDRNIHHLSEEGRRQAEEAGRKLKKKKIDLIIASPFKRTKETAEIVSETLGLSKESIVYDERLVEIQAGKFEKGPEEELRTFLNTNDMFEKTCPEGEGFGEMKKRLGDALADLEHSYEDKNILIITHKICAWLMVAAADRLDKVGANNLSVFMDNGKWMELEVANLPHNENYELDLHKPYIDEVVLVKDGEEYQRTPEVMDVWLDSGAMPFAQDSFDSAQDKPDNILYPANYISEAIDQTRGWFYTLHAIGVLMGKGRAYKNVICLGHILDKEGKKMSKSVGNVVSPWEMIDKYGVDALRLWMYSVNQPGESKNFDERTVDELNKRVFNLLDNVLSFYKLYAGGERSGLKESEHVLDRWILTRLGELTELTTEKLETYKLLEPVRAMREFIDDLSTWYLRRSRDRIKGGDEGALHTLRHVLLEVSKLLAPFAPFYAEGLYRELRGEDEPESVHLCEWPEKSSKFEVSSSKVLGNMTEVRRLVSLALDERQQASIKVRQPLGKLEVKSLKLEEEYIQLIKDEVNVKKVVENSKLDAEVALDTTITPELEEEGLVREEIRAIQDMRKEKNLNPSEVMKYEMPEDKKELYEKYAEEIKKATNIEFI